MVSTVGVKAGKVKGQVFRVVPNWGCSEEKCEGGGCEQSNEEAGDTVILASSSFWYREASRVENLLM